MKSRTGKKRKTKENLTTNAKNAVKKNKQAQWSVYKNLEKKAEKALAKLQSDVKKKASPATLIKDKNDLLLLLGECNYMARQYVRSNTAAKKKKKKKKS